MTLNKKIKNSLLSTHSQEELEAIRKWKHQLNENISELSTHLETSKITEELKDFKSVNTEAAFAKVSARIPELNSINEARVIKPSFITLFWKIAAVFVIVLGVIIGFNQWDGGQTIYEPQVVEVKTMNDGSIITIDQGSKLAQITDRTYELKGRAFFSVAKDPSQPFTVKTIHGLLTVLGTQFNIWTTDASTQISVTEGKVRFVCQNKEYVLIKGDVLVSNQNSVTVTNTKNIIHDSWRDKTLKFNDDPLHFVLENIAVYYKVNLVFKNKSEIDECKINSSFRDENVSQVLKELEILAGLVYEFDGKTILVKSFTCN